MKIVEKPLKLGELTFATFEEFAEYVKTHQLPKGKVIKRLEKELKEYEEKYHMSSAQFYREIANTPAEDEIDFLSWKMAYESYRELVGQDGP
jgi:predicted DNA-binding protein YlxM (UPF0122 family)